MVKYSIRLSVREVWVLIEYEKTFGYLGRVPGIYFGLRAGSSFPFFEVFGLRAGLSLAKFASDGRAGRPRLGLDTSLNATIIVASK